MNGDVRPFPIPPQAFTRAYRYWLSQGIDILEANDAFYECRNCGEIACICAAAAEEKEAA